MKRLVIVSVLISLLFGCQNQADTLEQDIKLLMKTVTETQGQGVFYDLVEAEGKEEDLTLLIDKAEEELEISQLALENVQIKSQEAKLIQASYLQALEKNNQAFLMIKEKQVNAQTEADFKRLIQDASKIQQEAVESCLNHLEIDIEEL